MESPLLKPPLRLSSPSVRESSSGHANVNTDRWLLQVGVEVTTGVLRGSRSQETDLYRVSQSETPRELLRSMSGTERAVSMGVFSSKLGNIWSSSPSLMSREGSRSQMLISALAHSKMLEFPEMAVDGSLGMSMSWGEGASWMPSSGGRSSPGLAGSSGEPAGSWKMDSISSDIWHAGLCVARTNSRRSFSLRRLAISVSNVAFSSSSLSVSFRQSDIQTSCTREPTGQQQGANDSGGMFTYSLQRVCEFPPSVATLRCSHFIPLPPYPLFLFLLWRQLGCRRDNSVVNPTIFIQPKHVLLHYT